MFEAVQPWLNTELYAEIEKKKSQEKDKLLSIAKVDDVSKVQTENAFNTFMRNLGISDEDLNGNG